MLKNIEKRFTLSCFFENKVHFYSIILVNTKTIRISVYIRYIVVNYEYCINSPSTGAFDLSVHLLQDSSIPMPTQYDGRPKINKFNYYFNRELLPLLTSRALPLSTMGRVYLACVRSVMMYGSESWPVRAENMCCIERSDMRMIQWMCNVSLKDRLRSDELRGRLNLESIGRCVQNRRLHWFGHIERMDKSFWVSRCRAVEVSS